jgi:SIR2-like domain
MESVALFLGSGFSAELGLPVTSKLQNSLLDSSASEGPEELLREQFISEVIATFWKDVFGWKGSPLRPSLEDHFTQIDLAANTGHYLGHTYSPKKLRAIRRMSIHRALKLVDRRASDTARVERFLDLLANAFLVSIVTTNWDIMAERCLAHHQIPFFYSHNQIKTDGSPILPEGIAVMKLHGSGNWGYCDCCRSLLMAEISLGKVVVHYNWLLEREDFELFAGGRQIANDLVPQYRQCFSFGGSIGIRIATFSYRKNLDVPAFQTIWDDARSSMARAQRWLFVGYSMPEADVEIRHLLKTAQLGRKDFEPLSIDVILKRDECASDRYKRFFGSSNVSIHNNGLENWTSNHLSEYCGLT